MNENKKFLEDLKNSKSFNESLDVIISFKESNKELSISEIIEMINIIVENGQVFGVLRPWKDGEFPFDYPKSPWEVNYNKYLY